MWSEQYSPAVQSCESLILLYHYNMASKYTSQGHSGNRHYFSLANNNAGKQQCWQTTILKVTNVKM